jgi:hypothetical protein
VTICEVATGVDLHRQRLGKETEERVLEQRPEFVAVRRAGLAEAALVSVRMRSTSRLQRCTRYVMRLLIAARLFGSPETVVVEIGHRMSTTCSAPKVASG